MTFLDKIAKAKSIDPIFLKKNLMFYIYFNFGHFLFKFSRIIKLDFFFMKLNTNLMIKPSF